MSKGKKRTLITLGVIFAVIFAVALGGFLVLNSYLGKIDFNDSATLQADPSLTAPKDDKLSAGDDGIQKNLNNNPELKNGHQVTNILLIGRDYGDEIDPNKYYSRADAMMLVSLDYTSKQIKITSLSRAVYAYIPGYGNDRLSHAHQYGGAKLQIKAIEANYKIKIDQYVSVDFKGFQSIIDVLGGIDLTLTKAEVSALPKVTKNSSGTYHLDGKASLAYARLRSIDSDRARTQRQRNVINALIVKAKGANVSTMSKLMSEIFPYVQTSYSKTELMKELIKAPDYLKWTVNTSLKNIPLDKTGKLVTINGNEYIIMDWEKNLNALQEFIYHA